ncbi:MAG: hypothetical protein AB7V36_11235 [Bacteroidales bacterium]
MPGCGSGFIADMIARIKANEAMKNEILKRRAKYVYYKTSNAIRLQKKEPSEAELQAIREKMREESRRERIHSAYALLVTIFVMIGLYLGFVFAFREYQKLQQYRNQKKINTDQEHIGTFGSR